MLTAEDFRRLMRDVDAKEYDGSADQVAMAGLSQALLVLGLREEDDPGTTPADLAVAFCVLLGSPAGVESVSQAIGDERSAPMMELSAIFAPDAPEADAAPHQSGEEARRFLEDIGVDPDAADVPGVAGGGGVRFVLTEEEKQAYVARAVGRNVHLVEPIMKAVEGALTWDEVDRAITEMTPDHLRDEDNTARSYRSRIT